MLEKNLDTLYICSGCGMRVLCTAGEELECAACEAALEEVGPNGMAH